MQDDRRQPQSIRRDTRAFSRSRYARRHRCSFKDYRGQHLDLHSLSLSGPSGKSSSRLFQRKVVQDFQ